MVLAPVVDLESKENAPNQVKNQAVGQFLEAKVGKIDAVLESKENAPNQAKDQTVADPQGSCWDDAKAKIVADTKANQKANHKANIADPEVKNLEDPEAVVDQKSVGGQDEGREPDGQHQKSVGDQDEGHEPAGEPAGGAIPAGGQKMSPDPNGGERRRR